MLYFLKYNLETEKRDLRSSGNGWKWQLIKSYFLIIFHSSGTKRLCENCIKPMKKERGLRKVYIYPSLFIMMAKTSLNRQRKLHQLLLSHESGTTATEFIRHFIVLGTKVNGFFPHMLPPQELELSQAIDWCIR